MQTQRIGIAMMCYLLPTPIASAVGGPLYEAAGYYATFGLSAICNFSAFIYLLLFVRESVSELIRMSVRLLHICWRLARMGLVLCNHQKRKNIFPCLKIYLDHTRSDHNLQSLPIVFKTYVNASGYEQICSKSYSKSFDSKSQPLLSWFYSIQVPSL